MSIVLKAPSDKAKKKNSPGFISSKNISKADKINQKFVIFDPFLNLKGRTDLFTNFIVKEKSKKSSKIIGCFD